RVERPPALTTPLKILSDNRGTVVISRGAGAIFGSWRVALTWRSWEISGQVQGIKG
ncbi:MAG: hypothetical protein RIR40_27, partial [Actinomycetota bacterium]